MSIHIEARQSKKYDATIYFLTKPGFPKQLILSAEELVQIAEYVDVHGL